MTDASDLRDYDRFWFLIKVVGVSICCVRGCAHAHISNKWNNHLHDNIDKIESFDFIIIF